jgi:hypothetical protein
VELDVESPGSEALMPWCDDCDRFWNPNSMAPDGSCPKCGRVLADHPDPDTGGAPWHFWVLVVLAAGYLLWRLIDFTANLFS